MEGNIPKRWAWVQTARWLRTSPSLFNFSTVSTLHSLFEINPAESCQGIQGSLRVWTCLRIIEFLPPRTVLQAVLLSLMASRPTLLRACLLDMVQIAHCLIPSVKMAFTIVPFYRQRDWATDITGLKALECQHLLIQEHIAFLFHFSQFFTREESESMRQTQLGERKWERRVYGRERWWWWMLPRHW